MQWIHIRVQYYPKEILSAQRGDEPKQKACCLLNNSRRVLHAERGTSSSPPPPPHMEQPCGPQKCPDFSFFSAIFVMKPVHSGIYKSSIHLHHISVGIVFLCFCCFTVKNKIIKIKLTKFSIINFIILFAMQRFRFSIITTNTILWKISPFFLT